MSIKNIWKNLKVAKLNSLGISCFYHDSALASIVVNNEIIAAVQEERFTREKHTPKFPINSIKYSS